MSYYSPQARNAANLPHRVSFASFAEGKRIEGKLSDWKKEYDELMAQGVRKHRSAAERAADATRSAKNKRGQTNQSKEALKRCIDKSWQEYRNEVEQVKLEG